VATAYFLGGKFHALHEKNIAVKNSNNKKYITTILKYNPIPAYLKPNK